MIEELRKQKLLIVDDAPTNIREITELLKSDYRVVFATSGPKALEMVATDSPPDLILLDIIMPEMDGIEVCRRLKSSSATKDIPIIFLTAKTESEDIIKGFQAGAVDYVTKPFNSSELYSRVHTHMDLKRSNEQLKLEIEERKKLIVELQEALAEVKALSGLLPICVSCKKIRDDKGYWNKLEAYIQQHSEAEFTHSICPECCARLYPELYEQE
ncbi:MAG: response regulator [Desulfobacterales bacterium]|nr:response regulator [Desulfobacterales bacterium]